MSAEAAPLPVSSEPQPPQPLKPPKPRSGWAKYALGVPLSLIGGAGALLLGLDTPMGHRLIADTLAGTQLSNGLRVSVARIDGSIYGQTRLNGLVLRDPQGVFLRAPEAVLDWRVLEFYSKGLVIKEAVVRRGTLLRAPQLRAGDPNASIWPDFDIAIDRFAIERLTVAKSLLGAERKVDLSGQLKLAKGVASLALDGKLGGEDTLSALLDAQRAQNRFVLKVDYNAPKGGLLAALSGAGVARRLAVDGKGTWTRWQGGLRAEQAGKQAADLQLTQSAGEFALAGQVWSDPLLSPAMQRMLGGSAIEVSGKGKIADRILRGDLKLGATNLTTAVTGAVDLGRSRFDGLQVSAKGGASLPLGEHDNLAHLTGKADIEGAFGAPQVRFEAQTARLALSDTLIEGLVAKGSAQRKDGAWIVPTKLSAARIITQGASFDEQLRPVTAQGSLRIKAGHIDSDDLALSIPHGSAKAAMRIDLGQGIYVFAGRAALQNWPTSLGAAAAQGPVVLRYLRGQPWRLSVDAQGAIANPSGAALAHLTGGALGFSGHIEAGRDHFLTITNGKANAPAINLAFDGARGSDGRIGVQGKGSQRRYGSFMGQFSLGDGGPRGSLHLADPYPALGIRDVDLAITPEAKVLRIQTSGQSALGPFEGALGLEIPADNAPAGAKTRLAVRAFSVSNTFLTGALDLGGDGAQGDLTLGGGGVSGTITLAPKGGGQGVNANITAKNARFEGDKPLTIALGRMKLAGLFQKNHTTLSGDLLAQGIGKSRLFIGSLAMAAQLSDGTGKVTAAIGGRRGSRFDVQATADVAPGRIALLAGGNFAGARISMPRRALLGAETMPDGSAGWRLAPSQIDFGGGRAIASGLIGNGSLELGLGLADMPLSLGDFLAADLGFGGKASGRLTYIQQREGLPSGEAHMVVKGLTRSGLMLVSRPVDVALVAKLGPQALDLRAVASESGQPRGRLQARIDNLAPQGSIADRLRLGHLVGQLRYAGPADALWRLMALESLDLTGGIEIAADMAGTLDNPQIRGSLAGDALRLQSAAAGMDVGGIRARGAFAGSTLSLTSLSGTAGGGQVSGSGTINFAGMEGGRGPAIDILIAARKAQVLARPDMAVTVTGPIRILSDGVVGKIAGRLGIDKARWKLGQAASASDLPNLAVKEINRRSDLAPASERQMPWRLMVDASGGGIRVQGLGMDSLWNADIKLRGALLEPAMAGAANLVEGSYDFASKHFELSRGRISFDGNSPPDPRLDIAANAAVSGLTATIAVRGTASKPEITFTSVPAMPEEELLSRILFGDSITQISAPEALQLGAALAALHGGGGLDPINKLRSAVGLDRLRFVSADLALGRQQGVAVGKYLHRHIYVELVTDGRGYSATNLEFRLTSWLAILGTIASTERQSINARLTKDY